MILPKSALPVLFAVGLTVASSAHAQASQGDTEQDVRGLVRQAVETELAADLADHTRWVYFELDQKPDTQVAQWVTQTRDGNLERVLRVNGTTLNSTQQRQKMNDFIQDGSRQADQKKSRKHDNEQAAELLKMLPNAFNWSSSGSRNGETILHFKPDPSFDPPDRVTRVFAAMEGDVTLSGDQHRILSLKGRLVHDVKFGFGFLAELKAGGTFDVERRKTAGVVWQITETHIHIEGHALFFKSISEQEDDVKSKFRQIPEDVTFAQAEQELLQEND